MTGRPEKDARLERLAAEVDDDAGAVAPSDEADRRTLDQLRALRDALRAAGPARASEGFAERVLERVAEEERMVKLFAQRARRDRVLVWVQAASLAALFLAYGGLLALTHVNHVGPRWQEQPAASARPDAQAAVDDAAPATRSGSRLLATDFRIRSAWYADFPDRSLTPEARGLPPEARSPKPEA